MDAHTEVRSAWITESMGIFGAVNVTWVHVMRKFEITKEQAKLDLRTVRGTLRRQQKDAQMFDQNTTVLIDLPGDMHHGKQGVVNRVESERMREIYVDKAFFSYCVAALREAKDDG